MGSELKYRSPSTHTRTRAEVWHRREAQFHNVHRCVTEAMESRLEEGRPWSGTAEAGGGSMIVMTTKLGELRRVEYEEEEEQDIDEW